MSEELYISTDLSGVNTLTRLEGLVSAIDGRYVWDRDELLLDAGTLACELVHSIGAWRNASRAKMTPEKELYYAITRYAKANGKAATVDHLDEWIDVLDEPVLEEVLTG